MTQQRQPGLHWISLSQQETPGEVLCCASLNKVKISEDEDLRPTKRCRASYASPPSLTLRPITLSPDITCPTGVLPQHKATWLCLSKTPREPVPADIARHFPSLCQSVASKPSRSRQNITRRFLMHLSLWSPEKQWPINNGKAYQYHAASPTLCWDLFTFLLNIRCPFMCLLQQNILSPVSASAKPHLTQLTFHRKQKLSLQEQQCSLSWNLGMASWTIYTPGLSLFISTASYVDLWLAALTRHDGCCIQHSLP